MRLSQKATSCFCLLGRANELVQVINDGTGFCFGDADYVRDETYDDFSFSMTLKLKQVEMRLRFILSQNMCLNVDIT